MILNSFAVSHTKGCEYLKVCSFVILFSEILSLQPIVPLIPSGARNFCDYFGIGGKSVLLRTSINKLKVVGGCGPVFHSLFMRLLVRMFKLS